MFCVVPWDNFTLRYIVKNYLKGQKKMLFSPAFQKPIMKVTNHHLKKLLNTITDTLTNRSRNYARFCVLIACVCVRSVV